MKRSIGVSQFLGFAITSLGGTILHFLYEWLGNAAWIAPFSGINESTWEHMKLLFWPMFLYAVIQSFFFKERKDFWCVKASGIVIGLVMIPVLFYTYNGVIGRSPDWINIAIFFISAAFAYIYETMQFKKNNIECKKPQFAFLFLCLIAVLFVVFTYVTPEIALFKDPITERYGLLS